jgi:DNA-directed RNA polymerase specialized sigma24 family protein
MRMLGEHGEAGLTRLGDDQLIAYVLAAREAGKWEVARDALRIFVLGMEGAVRAFVRNRLASHGETVADEVAERALEDAIRSIEGLRGQTAGEARAFVFKIARLRIVDFHRSRRPESTPLAALGEGDGPAALAPPVEGEADAVLTSLLLEQAMEGLHRDHRDVVAMFVLFGYTARETADHLSARTDQSVECRLSEQNVHQIGSRFRRDFRRRLVAAGA